MLGGRTKPNGRRKAAPLVLAAFLFAFVVVIVAPHVVRAQPNLGLTPQLATATGLATVDIRIYIGRVVKAFLALLGIIAVALIIYAGFLWMTSAGNPEKIDRAKKIIIDAVIGLLIILSAYAIVAFILHALTGEGYGIISPGTGTTQNPLLFANRGQDQLGNGIIDYHYPEPGQTGVPRNTKISITFKKPLALSTVFKHYDDKGTFSTSDDQLCSTAPPCANGTPVASTTVLELNTDNFKIIPNESLGSAGTGTLDQQFNNRYPDSGALVNPAPVAKVTAVSATFDPLQEQTLVMKPVQPLGSATTEVNYRVALRGLDTGIKAWSLDPAAGKPVATDAFTTMYPDGSYYWSFTTSTTIDTTPPQIVAVIPFTTPTPGTPASSVLDRNQLLQIYFSEAVDPTTASGVIGGGFTNVDVKAKCLPKSACTPPAGVAATDFFTVPGTLALGNRYRTAEFVPSAPCEGIAENSCGEPVYCLPKDSLLRVIASAATIGTQPPQASIDNGVEDMAGNSMDGNNNGAAEGPQPPAQPNGKQNDYYRNDPPTDLAQVSDTARWQYVVGSNVDLTVPVVTKIDPLSPPPDSTPYPAGPSSVPTDLPVAVTWTKTMSIGSIRTGGFDETKIAYTDSASTVVLRSRECAKTGTATCTSSSCPCTLIEPPGFFIDSGVPVEMPTGSGAYVTVMKYMHPVRPFFTANDLGYTVDDIAASPSSIPTYVPIVRAQLRDTKQNCFWPSMYRTPQGSECALTSGQNSCCDKSGTSDSAFLSACAPLK